MKGFAHYSLHVFSTFANGAKYLRLLTDAHTHTHTHTPHIHTHTTHTHTHTSPTSLNTYIPCPTNMHPCTQGYPHPHPHLPVRVHVGGVGKEEERAGWRTSVDGKTQGRERSHRTLNRRHRFPFTQHTHMYTPRYIEGVH